MKLRDYFAGQALVGWLASMPDEALAEYDNNARAFAEHQTAVAKACYGYADAMIKASKPSKAKRGSK